jgi:hypothetical protein
LRELEDAGQFRHFTFILSAPGAMVCGESKRYLVCIRLFKVFQKLLTVKRAREAEYDIEAQGS